MLNYKIANRELPTKDGKKKKYYFARTVINNQISFEEFCEELADGSTVDKADVMAVISRMTTVIARHLDRGNSVDCGSLGKFRPSVRSKSVESEDDFRTELMKSPAVIFTPRKDFKECLHNSSFRLVKDKKALEDGSSASSTTEGSESDPLGPNKKHTGL